MKITLLGAAGSEVTGSCYLLETASAKVLIDCGMFQGSAASENRNRMPTAADVARLDAVVLTHAHLDHTGRLPLLAKLGYRQPIYCTRPTVDLAILVLQDSARLQLSDCQRQNRKRAAQGLAPIEPLYGPSDVTALLPLFRTFGYDEPTEVAKGFSVRAVDAGHMLGSASLEVTVSEEGRKRVVVFSGDLGPCGAPIHRDPTSFARADILVLESTYGDRDHKRLDETVMEARDAIREAIEAKAKILVPSFAIGRSQVLLYLLAGAFQRNLLPPIPIVLDSPMAIEATEIYVKHVELLDDEARAMWNSGELSANLRTFRTSVTAEDSRALKHCPGPLLLIAGAGMCTGGRILHHFRHNLANPHTLVLFVGFQAHGSLGEAIVQGKKEVRLFGEDIRMRAKVHTLGGLSGHAGRTDLLRWFDTIAPSRPRVLLTHGEDTARRALARAIAERYGIEAELPGLFDVLEDVPAAVCDRGRRVGNHRLRPSNP
jgi:metallo-beta-lactamase family protein